MGYLTYHFTNQITIMLHVTIPKLDRFSAEYMQNINF